MPLLCYAICVKKITVYRYSPYVVEKKTNPLLNEEHIFVSFHELRSWIRSGEIIKHLFRYRDSTMLTYDLRLIAKPFASALLMRCLTWGKCIRTDSKGVSQEITVSLLFSLLRKLFVEFFKKHRLIKKIQSQIYSECNINEQSIDSSKKKKLDLNQPPVYLRSDFCFGLQSGGSVGHIAGVLNNLTNPIFISTDLIPTVRKDCEFHVVTPENTFWDFSEIPPLYFNDFFYNSAIRLIGNRHPSFIYQRYNLNNFSGIRLARYYKVPFVLEFNGSEIWVNRHWGNHILKYEKLADEIEQLNLEASDLIVVVSRPLKDQLIDRKIAPEKILVNPNGVDPEKYRPTLEGQTIRQLYHLQKRIVIGFIGTFGMWHGAEVLAKAFKLLLNRYPHLKTQVTLMLIGDGMMMPEVKKILSTCKENSILTGTIPQDSGPTHLAACDILVSPHVPNQDGTPFFGSPTKLFEYMAMGKGIVASNLDQIGELLEHNHSAWMVEPGNVESLAEGIKKLIDEPLLRDRLGKAARAEVCAKYTWQKHTKKIIETLETETIA